MFGLSSAGRGGRPCRAAVVFPCRRRSVARFWSKAAAAMPVLKYRLLGPGLAPRRTELPVPGWAGEAMPRANGAHEQIWHCVPFSEGARYGLEILYPFEQELRVRASAGASSSKPTGVPIRKTA